MKKFLSLVLTLTFFSTVLNSCSSDDDNGNNSNSQIVGTWGTDWNDGNIYPKFTFLSNGNVKYYTYPSGNQPELEEIGTYNLNGDILIMEFPETVLIKFKNKVTFTGDTELEFEEINESGFDSWSEETYFKTDDPNLN